MKLIIFNLIGMVRRYRSSLLLNILGMSIAFASFIIIMIQVLYDLRYDAFHSNADRLYRIEVKMANNLTPHVSTPFGYAVINSSPDIEKGSWYHRYSSLPFYTKEWGASNAISSEFTRVDTTMLTMFDFTTISGDIARIDHMQSAMVSEKTARKYFNTTDVVGKELFMSDGKPVTVVAVFKEFAKNTFLRKLEVVMLNSPDDPDLSNSSNWNHIFLLMLKKGANIEKVLNDIGTELVTKEVIRKDIPNPVNLSLLGDIHFDTYIRYDSFEKASYPTTMTLLSVALVILLIASINFVNFATALVPQRIRNINTQKVLGGTVAILRVSLVIESLAISLVSFGVSLLILYFVGTTSFSSLISASIDISENFALVAMLGLLAVITGVIAGLYPAFYTTSFAPALVLKGNFGLSARGRKLRTSLIGFQFFISFILVASAIFVRVQNDFMKGHDVGFDRGNIINVMVPTEVAKNPSAFRDKLMQNPSIKGLTFGQGQLISDGKMGWGRKYNNEDINFDCFPVSTDFLDVMGMRVVDGRNFIESDSLRTDGVFIFNEFATKTYGIKVGDKIDGHNGEAEVVGVVKDFNFQPMQYAIQPLCLYVMGSEPWYYPRLAFIRVSGDLRLAKEHVENCLRTVAPNNKDVDIYVMDEGLDHLYKKEDNLALLITIFSILAIVISIIGVFGIVMFDSRYRRKEIALRKVHGSTVWQILMMFTKYYVYTVLICFVISIPFTYYILDGWLNSFAYRSQIHVWVFLVSLLVVASVTVVTVVTECMRAATENPSNSLKGGG